MKIIEEYIKKININDIESYANKNGIQLSRNELNIVYNYIVNDWRTIMYGNPRGIFDKLKQEINENSYNKIENLFTQFKNNYL